MPLAEKDSQGPHVCLRTGTPIMEHSELPGRNVGAAKGIQITPCLQERMNCLLLMVSKTEQRNSLALLAAPTKSWAALRTEPLGEGSELLLEVRVLAPGPGNLKGTNVLIEGPAALPVSLQAPRPDEWPASMS